MATGPENYRTATQVLDSLAVVGNPTAAQILAVQIVQARATLALAAATAMGTAGDTMPTADWNAWREVAGVRRPGED